MTRDRLPTPDDERNYDEQHAERNELAAYTAAVGCARAHLGAWRGAYAAKTQDEARMRKAVGYMVNGATARALSTWAEITRDEKARVAAIVGNAVDSTSHTLVMRALFHVGLVSRAHWSGVHAERRKHECDNYRVSRIRRLRDAKLYCPRRFRRKPDALG